MRFASIGLCLALGCSSPRGATSTPATNAVEFGVCFHHHEEYNAAAAKVLDDLRSAGPFWIRGDFQHPDTDAVFAKDMRSKQINVLALLPWYKKSRDGWETYVESEIAVVDAPAWEITNEPEMPWWGGPIAADDYMTMLKHASAAIKARHPHAQIIGPAVGATAEGIAYLSKLIDAGLLDYVDGVSVHYYIFHKNTDLEGIKRVVAGRKPLWITETGWTTADQPGGEEAQHKYVHDYYDRTSGLLGSDPAVRVIFNYELNDDRYPVPAGKDDGWGLTRGAQGQYKPKQAYAQLKALLGQKR